MSRVQEIADPQYVKTQYQNTSNLNARIRLHELFSTNKYGWLRWLFDQYDIPPQSCILELGCGAGNIWAENLDRIPKGIDIVLSDFSEGMLQEAQENISNNHDLFQFRKIDAQSIPFDDNSFDIVLANHLLYHVPYQAKALSEIQRVLNPTGRFYASTIGKNHLKELGNLLGKFDSELASLGRLPSNSFNLENGITQLSEYFTNVSLYRYTDSLIVTDANMLMEYILSGMVKLDADHQVELAKFVKQEFEESDGKFYISKDSGVFESYGIL